MKLITLISVFLYLQLPQTGEKLNGKYKVVSSQNEAEYVIVFNDSVYKKVFSTGKEVKGVIKYGYLIYLVDYESSQKVINGKTLMVQTDKLKEDEQISLRNAGKDKFSFCFSKYRKDGPMNWLDICQSSGNMFKVE